MALPELTLRTVTKLLDDYCAKKVPAQYRDRVRLCYAVRGHSITLYEERPAFMKDGVWVKCNVAQFRYDADGEWTLYCRDRNSRWHEDIECDPTKNFAKLLKEVDADPTGIFWG